MAPFRLGAVILALWGLDLLFVMLFPVVRVFTDPLFALLIFLAFRKPSVRFLWLQGFGLGFLKDLLSVDLFGAWAVTFALTGWVLAASRQMVEWEDPAIVGAWAAALTLLSWVVHGIWLVTADPWLRWNQGSWLLLPLAMALQGWCCALLFPRFQRLMRKS